MTTSFEKGEVVWGKIKGYPWWPAVITDFNNNLIYTIKFYSDNSCARLSSKFLLKYEENKNKILEANKKNKKLIGAIKEADLAIKRQNKSNNIYVENYSNNNDINNNKKSKNKIDNEIIQIKKINNSNHNFELKNIEKINNNDIKNNLINKIDIMSNQNNRVNIFSIVKNNKNNNTLNISSPLSKSQDPEENNMTPEKKNINYDQNGSNDIIINKHLLTLENDDEINMLLLNNKNTENKKKLRKEKIKEKKEENTKEKEKEKDKDKGKEKEIKPEKNFIKIEIENLEIKVHKKKEAKIKTKTDEKNKEEKKKREEEDNFILQIDEYFYKIYDLFNNKKYDELNYEKEQFKRVLTFLSKYKRENFIEFLKMTNISKYIQYFICYSKSYDLEINNLAKKVYRNFHIQFNRDFFKEPKVNLEI